MNLGSRRLMQGAQHVSLSQQLEVLDIHLSTLAVLRASSLQPSSTKENKHDRSHTKSNSTAAIITPDQSLKRPSDSMVQTEELQLSHEGVCYRSPTSCSDRTGFCDSPPRRIPLQQNLMPAGASLLPPSRPNQPTFSLSPTNTTPSKANLLSIHAYASCRPCCLLWAKGTQKMIAKICACRLGTAP